MRILKKQFTIVLALLLGSYMYAQTGPTLPGGNDKWQLFWNDEFSYPNATLDTYWISANDSLQSNILCARLRRNAVVSNGTLKLQNKKEKVGTKEWTSGSVWTKRTFQYGYFECRYRYAAAPATNNSFWFMSSGVPTLGKKFEIDVNEGHYPAEMATNIHNWSDITTNPTTGVQSHPSSSVKFSFATKPDVNIQLEIPITTRRIRLTSNYATHFHLQEFRIYNVNQSGYPTTLSPTADTDISGLVNLARDAQTVITSSGIYGAGYEAINAADGGLTKHWVSQAAGQKWIEFNFPTDKTIGCIQFISGWVSGGSYVSVLNDYKVQYFDGTNWVDIQTADASTSVDFGRDYHYLGLEWTKDSLTFYHDGVAKRKVKNDFCYSGAPMYLSEAIITWAGTVTDAIDGTQMEVDYVRAYQPVDPNVPYDLITNGGFETLTSTLPAPWELNRTNSTISRLAFINNGNQADGVRSLGVINSAALPDTFSTNIAQKIPIPSDGLYEIRLKARATNSAAGSNNISLKLANEYSGITNLMNGDSTIEITPTASWNSYKFSVNLKEDFDNKLYIGVSNYGSYDLDSISIVRVGEVLLSVPSIRNTNNVTILTFRQSIRIHSDTRQHVDVFGIDGRCVFASELDEGTTDLNMSRSGLYIVRLKNRYGVVSKKVILTSY